MTEDCEIELQGKQTNGEGHIRLPENFLLFGEIENDDVKVYIRQDVYKALEKYALADVEHERGAIILGDYSEEADKTCVIISSWVEAKYTDASASTLTFTHETWDYVHKQQERLYPKEKIVGWQHTHPNYGIFLSNYDMFIQENFFNLPFQIAYVIDPIQNLRGFFQWKNGKVEKLKGFYVYDDAGAPVKIEQSRVKAVGAESEASNKAFVCAALLLCACVLIFSVFLSKINWQFKLQRNRLNSLEQIVVEQAAAIRELQSSLKSSSDTREIAAEELKSLVESQKLQLDNQGKTIERLQEYIEKLSAEKAALLVFKPYAVQAGDTLTAICRKCCISYFKNIEIIKSVNSLKNENEIYVGQTILLPVQGYN